MTAEELWSALHDAATDYQRDVLDEVAQAAGWRWRCEGRRRGNPDLDCGWINPGDAPTCEDCGEAKP